MPYSESFMVPFRQFLRRPKPFFGHVIVEAMACSLPVAAFPLPGPVDVVADLGAGALNENLCQACIDCLDIPRKKALERAQVFTWENACQQFSQALVPMFQAKGQKVRPSF